MIGTINSIVSKVVDTVSGPIYSWGSKPSAVKVDKTAKVVASKAAGKAKAKGKAKARKCCSGKKRRRA